MGLLPIPRSRAYLGATSAWFGAVWARNTDGGLDFRLLSTCTAPWHVTLPPSGRYTLCCGRGAGVPVSIPMALRSSSMSGQWTPCPVPIISKCCRCSGVALAKRHDQTRGTLMVRPSARCAVIRSSVTSTERIRGSLLAKMVMPGLQDTRQVLHNKGANSVQFARGKAMIYTQGNRGQPKLTYHPLTAHMDVRRFMTNKR